MKSKVTVAFYCYTNAEGMQRQILGPTEEDLEQDPDPDQEKLDLDAEAPEFKAEDKAEDDAEEPEEAEAEAEETPKKLGLTMTSGTRGIYTGKVIKGDITLCKDEVRDLLEAEAQGLRAMFVLELKDN